ncbi:MAG TPA: FHA domain-containing protein, partial [Polyangiaceae bacterium]|nr:FHA domain-containing protein [Polyangiaceae bacterium]
MAKWTLTIEEEGGQTHRVELTRDAYTIGRDPSNDIVFRERNISRRHARLERAGPGRWALIDEGSRFGCFINGERLQDRGVISPVDAVHLGGYHLSILSSSGGKRGLQPALSVTRSLLVPLDVPPKLRLFDGLAPVADVRLDRGPVSFGSDSDCTVRLLGVEGALVHIRPLPGGSFEIVDRGDVVLVRLKGQELRRKILENADLFDLGDDLAIRFLQGGRHARADEPNFSPSPLVDLSNGVAEAKVLGVEGVPVLRQGPPKTAASSTLVGLQAPRPPPLPAPPAAAPAGAVAWHPEQQDTPTHAEGFQPPPSVDPPTTRTPYESSSPRPPGYESPTARPPAYESPSGQMPYEGGARPPFDSSAGRTAEMPAGRPSHAPLPSRTVELPAGGRPMPQPMRGMTERLAPVPPSQHPQHPQHPQHSQPPPPAPNPMAQSDDSWTPGVPAADMGWPMGQHQPSSVPNPPPEAWWYAGTAGPPG